MVPIRNVPGFNGYAPPRLAYALNDFFGTQQDGGIYDLVHKTENASRAIMQYLFVAPFIHQGNVGMHYMIGRGWENLTPFGIGRQFKYTYQAYQHVLNMTPTYENFLRHSSGLLYSDAKIGNFHEMLMHKMFNEQLADQGGMWSALADKLGFQGANLREKAYNMVQSELTWSRQSLWRVGDMFMLARQLELQDRGLPIDEAIRQTHRDIPSYQVGSALLGQPWLATLMKSPAVLNFGRYKVGQIGAVNNMVQDAIRGKSYQGTSRFEAIGKILIMATMAMGVYPHINHMLQSVFGEGVTLKPFGPLALTDAAYGWWSGQKSWAAAASSFASTSPILDLAAKIHDNEDIFGKPIINGNKTPTGIMADAIRAGLQMVYPGQLLMHAIDHGTKGVYQALGDMAGISSKTPVDPKTQQYFKTQDERNAAKSENADNLAGAIRWMFNQAPATVPPNPNARVPYTRPTGGMKHGF
jgi:hypothetical protein